MKNNIYKKKYIPHFFLLALWMTIIIYFQSYILCIFPKPFYMIDLATIAIVYFFIENDLTVSFFLAILSGSLLDSLSTVKPGFFIIFFLITLLILQFLSKLLSFDILSNKLIAFLGIFLLKFAFLYFLIDTHIVSIITFITKSYGYFLVSSIAFVIFVKTLDIFKSYIQKYNYSYNPNLKSWR